MYDIPLGMHGIPLGMHGIQTWWHHHFFQVWHAILKLARLVIKKKSIGLTIISTMMIIQLFCIEKMCLDRNAVLASIPLDGTLPASNSKAPNIFVVLGNVFWIGQHLFGATLEAIQSFPWYIRSYDTSNVVLFRWRQTRHRKEWC